MSGPIFGLCSEHLSVVLRGIGFIRFQTRRNATTSTIAEVNIVITRSFFVCSRQRSTTYRLKRSSSMWSEQCGITGKRICPPGIGSFTPNRVPILKDEKTNFVRVLYTSLHVQAVMPVMSAKQPGIFPHACVSI